MIADYVQNESGIFGVVRESDEDDAEILWEAPTPAPTVKIAISRATAWIAEQDCSGAGALTRKSNVTPERMMTSNYEAAIKSEMKRVIRTFWEYDVNTRCTMMQSRSLRKMAVRGGPDV